jgi:predicted ATPase/GAF domain-containing protein/anti-anti-sigma regulatory factor
MTMLSQYTLLREILRGEGYVLYSGHRSADGAKVLVKILARKAPTPREIAALRHEYAIVKDLDLASVVRAHSLEQQDNHIFFVMEDPGGRLLSEVIREGGLDLRAALRVGAALASALASLHDRRVIHKDIKPAHIFVDVALDVALSTVKFHGFGVATRLSQEIQPVRALDSLEGTLAYMSPEQTGRMNRILDYRTDFYSLGVTLYEMLARVLPFATPDPLEIVHGHIARRPAPPHEIRPEIPEGVSAIVMKLLSKSAEDRYRSASGLATDLEACIKALDATGQVPSFPLGQDDVCLDLVFPQKLYGREAELSSLSSAWERASRGAAELLLVSGYSGVGKSALVGEVQKTIAQRGGYFVAGKFDQLSRSSVPHGAIARAFRELIKQILTERTDVLALWKAKLADALGAQGRVLVDFVPELSLLVGPQPRLPELEPVEAQNRFNVVFQRFLRVFTTSEHPLAVFLDDLQWADPASLKFLELLLSAPGTGYLLVIGAYRDNEVGKGHPLELSLSEIRRAGVTTSGITLLPLSFPCVVELIADALAEGASQAEPLAEIVFSKAGGNPFFVRQFLKAVYDAGRITFDARSRRFTWDVARIREMGITDNVVELMTGKIRGLPPETQRVLKLAACIGHRFDLTTLSIIDARPPGETASALWAALREGLVLPVDADYRFVHAPDTGDAGGSPSAESFRIAYRFLHDRIQQAAYLLIDGGHRDEVHLRIGRLLLAKSGPDPQGDELFDVVSHMNRGRASMTEASERLLLARLNLEAGRRAKAATAYDVAAGYLEAGISILGDAGWEREHALSFELWMECAECEYKRGAFEETKAQILALSSHARSTSERTRVFILRITFLLTMGRAAAAVDVGREALAMFGVDLPETEEARKRAVEDELAEIQSALEHRRIAELIEGPTLADPDKRAVLKLFSNLVVPSYQTSQTLFIVVAIKQVSICLKHGHSEMAAYAYMIYGWILAVIFGKNQEGEGFGRLALDLNERLGHADLRCKLYFLFGEYGHLFLPLRTVLHYVRQAVFAGLESGDFIYLSFAYNHVLMDRLGLGDDLSEIREEASQSIALMQRTKVASAAAFQTLVRQVVANLTGSTLGRGTLSDGALDEAGFVASMESAGFAANVCFYYVLKLMLSFLYEDYEQALSMAAAAEPRIASGLGQYFTTELPFYASLTLLAREPPAQSDERERGEAALARHEATLLRLAQESPATHRHKRLLVSAERARLAGEELLAMRLYDEAIFEARERGFLHHEALANELSGKFHLAASRTKIARAYLTDAYQGYARWGATAKLEALLDKYPHLLDPTEVAEMSYEAPPAGSPRGDAATARVSVELFNTAAMIRAAEAIAGEVVVEKVLERLMRLSMENAGARRGVLMLVREGQLLVEASVTVDPDVLRIGPGTPVEASVDLPLRIVHYVHRTGEPVVLGDATSDSRFVGDPHIVASGPKSILCLALARQGRITGVLYLENSIVTNAFTMDRVEVCRVLTSQAAIALENALLTTTLQRMNDKLEQEVMLQTEELRKAYTQLERELAERKRSEEERAALKDEIIKAQKERLAELSTPLIPITKGIVVMPLIGTMDSERAEHMLTTVLSGVRVNGARVVIIDVTGARRVDAGVSGMLIRMAGAVALLGAQMVITGIRPEVAQSLAGLSIDFGSLTSHGTLEKGIAYAMRRVLGAPFASRPASSRGC